MQAHPQPALASHAQPATTAPLTATPSVRTVAIALLVDRVLGA